MGRGIFSRKNGIGLTFLFLGTTWFARAEDSLPSSPYHLEKTFSKKVEVTLESLLKPSNGVLVFPVAGNGPNQKILRCEMSVEFPKEKFQGTLTKDLSKLAKPVLRTLVNSKDSGKATARIHAELYNVKLVEGEGPKKTTLTTVERSAFTANERYYEHADPRFKAWMKGHQLHRKKGERDIEFAYRLLGFMREEFRYKIIDLEKVADEAKEKKTTEILLCTQSLEGECWALSRVYSAVLRANGIPCKQVAGRLIMPGQSSHGTTHVKVEAFLDNSGWLPIEVAATVNLRDIPLGKYFANGGDYMVVMNQGNNYDVQGFGKSVGKFGTFSSLVALPAGGKWELLSERVTIKIDP